MAGHPPSPTIRANEFAHWVPAGHGLRSHCGVSCTPAPTERLRTLQACPSCDQYEPGFWHRSGTDIRPDNH